MHTIIASIVIYFVLLFMMRLIARRAPNTMTPSDMLVTILFAGLSVPSVMGKDRSITNVFLGIMTIGIVHLIVSSLKVKSRTFGKIADGTPVVLFSGGKWYESEMRRHRIMRQDVLAAARMVGIEREDQMRYAILERNGSLSVVGPD